MTLQELKNQAYKLSVSERLELVNAIIESIQPELRLRPPVPLGTLTQLRGLLKTDAPPPTDAEVEVMLEERLVEKIPTMKVLIDTNVILDVFLDREPFAADATTLFQAIEFGQVQGYVTATTLTDIFYIVRKNRGIESAQQTVSRLLTGMQICTVDRRILEVAVSSMLRDFEDAVQLACATFEHLDAIVTRNPQDFAGAALPILPAGELLERLTQ